MKLLRLAGGPPTRLLRLSSTQGLLPPSHSKRNRRQKGIPSSAPSLPNRDPFGAFAFLFLPLSLLSFPFLSFKEDIISVGRQGRTLSIRANLHAAILRRLLSFYSGAPRIPNYRKITNFLIRRVNKIRASNDTDFDPRLDDFFSRASKKKATKSLVDDTREEKEGLVLGWRGSSTRKVLVTSC